MAITTTRTDAPSSPTASGQAPSNALAPVHSRPSHPHPKKSRRLIKKKQKRRGEFTEPANRPARRRPSADNQTAETPMSALLVPLAAVIGLAILLRITLR
jgi:hypothetical protein